MSLWWLEKKKDCPYCGKPRSEAHSCPGSEDLRARLQATIDAIHAQMKRPGSQPMTSLELRNRADRRKQMATSIKINGGRVKPEYE